MDSFGFASLPKCQGFKGILVIIDSFSAFTLFIPITDKRATTIWNAAMKYWMSIFGFPKQIHADFGGEFHNNFKKVWCEQLNIKETFCSIDSHFQNGKAERVQKYLRTQLKALLLAKNTRDAGWPSLIPSITAQYNSHFNRTLGDSPYHTVFGMDFEHAVDAGCSTLRDNSIIKDAFWSACEKAAEQYDSDLKPTNIIDEEDLVWLIPKQSLKRKNEFNNGPWRVKEVLANNTYRIQHLQTGVQKQIAKDRLRIYGIALWSWGFYPLEIPRVLPQKT